VYDDGLPSGGRRLAFEVGDDEDVRIGLKKGAPSGSTVRLTDIADSSADNT
jgi:hypothetical protein